MVRFAADENITRQLVVGLRRRLPSIDLVTVTEAGLAGADDPTVLAWAAEAGRVLLSHDLATMADFAHERVAAGQPMPGVFAIKDTLPLGVVIEDLVLAAELGSEDDWKDGVHYLPLT